ncbi:hypothetical protein [uncultured Kordia sp.]|uniref:hypothetical protein n=1 Tax=uncultured Kordia sp. TaxID=507699 RepID=UPI00261E717D|nr:hypothetical protein [uncultured Kordia sp.]
MTKNKDKKDVLDLANKSIWFLRLASLIIGILFAKYVVFSPFTDLVKEEINNLSYLLVLKIMLIFLFNSRLYGVFMDLKEMKREFIKISSNKFPWQGYILLLLFTVSFSSMIIYHSENFELFIILYLLFWILDMLFWQTFKPYIKKRVTDTFRANKYNEVEKLQNRIFWDYFSSNWMRDSRNWALSFIFFTLLITVGKFETDIQSYLKINSENLISSILLLTSVILTETIAWTKRLKRKYQIRFLDQKYLKIKNTIEKNNLR